MRGEELSLFKLLPSLPLIWTDRQEARQEQNRWVPALVQGLTEPRVHAVLKAFGSHMHLFSLIAVSVTVHAESTTTCISSLIALKVSKHGWFPPG